MWMKKKQNERRDGSPMEFVAVESDDDKSDTDTRVRQVENKVRKKDRAINLRRFFSFSFPYLFSSFRLFSFLFFFFYLKIRRRSRRRDFRWGKLQALRARNTRLS